MWYTITLCIFTEGGSVIRGCGKLADLALNFDKNDMALRPAFKAKAHTDAVSYTHLTLPTN